MSSGRPLPDVGMTTDERLEALQQRIKAFELSASSASLAGAGTVRSSRTKLARPVPFTYQRLNSSGENSKAMSVSGDGESR